MTFPEFKKSLRDPQPPDLSPLLVSLWWDGKNKWDQAHDVAQDIESPAGSWVHAYLHRREGDLGNAAYWYRRAGRSMPSSTLEAEWADLVNYFLQEKK